MDCPSRAARGTGGRQIKDLTPHPAPYVLAVLAAAAPSLLAFNPPPSPTFLNQAVALVGWGLFVAVAGGRGLRAGMASAWMPLAALGLLAFGVLLSWGPGALPAPLALSALGLLAASAVLLLSGAAGRGDAARQAVFVAFCWGWLIAGLLNAGLAAVQVFAPAWADGSWVARSGLVGRAVGNLRQPNHLSSLLLWSAIAVVALLQMQRLRPWPARVLFALGMGAVVLTASRTGGVSVLLLAAWGAADRGLARGVRGLLLSAPALYALAWGAMWFWAAAGEPGEHAFGGAARLQETDLSSSRFGIWANTLALIARHPWAGVGWGEFNLAWTLTPFPGRPTAFFDHAHNLPLHLAAELGLPLAAAVLALLTWALWRAWRGGPARPSSPTTRCAAMFVLMIGVHSLLEYPLWYAYFLLPAAWAWGFALGRPAAAGELAGPAQAGLTQPAQPTWPRWAGAVLVVAAALSTADYLRVVRIFSADPGAVPLARRVADGRRSLLFSHHADYAAATTGLPQPDGPAVYAGAAHYLLDTRLMAAWARDLAANGDEEAARHVAARLQEFGADRAPGLFGACDASTVDTASAASVPLSPAWACTPPTQPLNWQALVRGRRPAQPGSATQ